MNGQQELNDALHRVVRPSQNYYDVIFRWSKWWINGGSGERFTSEILRINFELFNISPTPAEPRVYGAVINQLRIDGKIRHAGYTKATNRQAHCRPISVWEVV